MSMRRLEVDGVPTLFVQYSGPMIAGLTFRVGQADETLPYRGITHLLEHLVLHGHGLTDYHYNGSTGAVATVFHLQGGEDDIIAYLGGVCSSLQELPLERLQTERQVLRAEAGGRGGGVNEALPLWRYGARDHGLPAYPEMGLPRITGDDLVRWAATWFTRQNAVLWVAGERIPPGLRLMLGDGVRRPVPAAGSALRAMPAYFEGDTNHVVFDGIVRRGVAGSVLSGVLERELYRSLRQEDGNSYTATAAYDPRGDGWATVTAFADAVPDKHDAVLGGFVDVLAKLKAGRIDPADVDAVRAKAEDSMRGPMAEAGRLPGRALDLLTGAPVRSLDDIRADMRALTVADVHGSALELLGTGLLQVPRGHSADWAGFDAAPDASERQIEGERFTSWRDPAVTLIVGPEGIGLDVEGRPPCAILYRECAVALAYPDGGRQLIGLDSLTIRIEPTVYRVPAPVLRQIDAAVAAVTVQQPPRDPKQIPTPAPPLGPDGSTAYTPPPYGAVPPSAPAGSGTGRLVGGVVVLVLALVALCCSGVLSAAVADNSDPANDVPLDGVTIAMQAVGYLSVVVLAGAGVHLLRTRNRK